MRLYLVLAIAATALWAADEPKPSPKPAAKAAKAGPLKVPAGAVEIEPGLWKYTDAQGVKWHYRTTPFGIARLRADAAGERKAAPPPGQEAVEIRAVAAEDDTIRFERPGPFGVYRWTKKLSELNENEKAAWERFRASSAQQE